MNAGSYQKCQNGAVRNQLTAQRGRENVLWGAVNLLMCDHRNTYIHMEIFDAARCLAWPDWLLPEI
jgi:hypothetical protein